MDAQGAGETRTRFFRGYLALRRQEKLAGVETAASGKQRERKKRQRGRLGLISRPGAHGIDTQRAPHASAKPRAVAGAPGRPEKGRQRWGGGRALFTRITELPSILKFKLLPKFLKKLKISKNKSCSTFQVLQLCLNERFQILPPF